MRIPSINRVQISGRVVREPELKYTPKGLAVLRFDIAVNRRYKDISGEWKDDTVFVRVNAWRELAERVAKRVGKGTPIYVEGRLKNAEWTSKEGVKRSRIEVEARSIQIMSAAQVVSEE
ncbi:MAG: single-stranded DNA-binding protein [bacterium]|nr:single-stranded DNA-binding protein [bacterium]